MKTSRVSPHRTWHGVRMRRTEASPDPDHAPRPVTLPASWDDSAAAALVALTPNMSSVGPVTLAGAAQAWIAPIAAAATEAGFDMPLADRLHRLLLLRRGAPTEAIWRLQAEDAPGFVLNLPAFLDSDGQLDFSDIAEAVETAVIALSFAAPQVRDIDVGVADLAGLLAALGVDYGSDAARDIARCIAAIVRGQADAASGRLARLSGPTRPAAFDWPTPPAHAAVRGLPEAARAARQAAAGVEGMRHRATTAITRPGLAEALLGCETGGIAPAFAAIGSLGRADPSGAGVAGGERDHGGGGTGHRAGRRKSNSNAWFGCTRGDARCGRTVHARDAAASGAAGSAVGTGSTPGTSRAAQRIHAEGFSRRAQVVPADGRV